MRNRNGCSSLVAVLIALAASPAADAQCEVNELLPEEHEQYDRTAEKVAIFGDTILVDGHQDDDYCPDDPMCNSGSAYVFRLDPDLGRWIQVQELHSSDPAEKQGFGLGLGIDGETMVIGAFGDQNDGGSMLSGIGAGYIFRFDTDSGQWIEQQKLTADDGEPGDTLGYPAVISGDVVMLGANGDDDLGDGSGAVYAFRFDPDQSMWVQEQKLLAEDGAASDVFSYDVDVEGDVAVVGARYDDDHGTNCGAAYIFRYHPENPRGKRWVQEQKLVPREIEAGDRFGEDVAVSGQVIAVGASFDDGDVVESGAVYVFRYDGEQWVQEQRLLASDAEEGDHMRHVDIDGDVIVVSAPNDGDMGDRAGCGYVFTYNGSAWEQWGCKIYASDGNLGDGFGCSLALHDPSTVLDKASSDIGCGWSPVAVPSFHHRAVFGAFRHEHGGHQAGAAYAFDIGRRCDD